MVVVAIVGILSMLAVVGYRKFIDSSHTSEGIHVVQSIRVAQETYHAETGTYANISTSLDATLCPVHAAARTKVPWDSTCSGGVTTWAVLPVRTDGPVLFGYATKSGGAGGAPAPPSGMANTPAFGTPTNDWFTISAKADINNSADGIVTTVVGVSWTNDLLVDRDGE